MKFQFQHYLEKLRAVIKVGDYVVIQLTTMKNIKKKYIGNVIEVKPCQVKFLKKGQKLKNSYVFPNIADISVIEKNKFVGRLEDVKIGRIKET